MGRRHSGAKEECAEKEGRLSGITFDAGGLIVDLNRRHNQTFVIVTHAPDVAARCHRIVYMKDGQIVREEVPAGAGA